jgi:LPS-assembly lipoprotein
MKISTPRPLHAPGGSASRGGPSAWRREPAGWQPPRLAVADAASSCSRRRISPSARSVGAAPSSSLGNELKRTIAFGDGITVIADAARIDSAQVVLDVLADQREKVVVGLNASGQVREFQLRTRFRFKLRTPQGKELIPETELLQQRDISFNESVVLAKEAEENLLYREMQTDLVQQLMRRLAALKSI